MAVPPDFDTNSQFQWYAARKLFAEHQADKHGANHAWVHISGIEKEAWRIVALLGIYSGWSAL